jgi:PKD repeat protein
MTADASGSTDTDRTGIARYAFSFGDGTPDVVILAPNQPIAAHVYRTTGNFTVKVTVTDTAGQSSSAQRKVKVARR